jgi:hypothetical protein
MRRGYWVRFCRSVSNPAAVTECAALAGPAIQAGGGRFLAWELPNWSLRLVIARRLSFCPLESKNCVHTCWEETK